MEVFIPVFVLILLFLGVETESYVAWRNGIGATPENVKYNRPIVWFLCRSAFILIGLVGLLPLLVITGLFWTLFFVVTFADISLELWHRRITRRISSEHSQKYLLRIYLIISISLLLFSAGMLRIVVMDYYPRYKFNTERWLARENVRYQMSEDLVESKILIGKTKKETKIMLGKGRSDDSDNFWEYFMGTKPGFDIGPDFELLFIKFTKDTVVSVEQYNLD